MDHALYVPIATLILFSLGAFRMLLLQERYKKIAFFNYLNISNLLVYTFNTLHGLLYNIIPVVIFFAWKTGWIILLTKTGPCPLLIFSGFSAVSYYCRKFGDMTYGRNVRLKFIVEAGLFCLGLSLMKSFSLQHTEIIKLAILAIFLFAYLKISNDYEDYIIRMDVAKVVRKIIYKGKEDNPRTLSVDEFVVTNTLDVVFIYNIALEKLEAIQMSEIHSITQEKSPDQN